jgi:NADPH:quinone reductase-like Zn-dependent oxidoreductase
MAASERERDSLPQAIAQRTGSGLMKLRYKILSAIGILALASASALAIAMSHNSPCGAAPPPPAGAPLMKAIVYRCYGPPEVLKMEQLPLPLEEDKRMIVKVHAASVNPLDWHYMRGEPYVMRAGAGFGTPDIVRMGVDFAGTVVSVGKDVTRFKPGDMVFGGKGGAFGEYISVSESGSVAMKPSNMTFEQAAAVPIAAVTALQALRDKGRLRAGQAVLVNGASGGVGTYAVQIAKAYGAEVTGVCSTKNLSLVKSIGADHVIDYTREDFTQGTQQYDLILDIVGTHSLSDYRRVLKPQGALVIAGSLDKGHWLGPLTGTIDAMLYSRFVSQQVISLLADLNARDLEVLRDMIQAGKITSVIDRRYPLDEVPEAIRYLEQGHARGKVVVAVDSESARDVAAKE